MLFGQKTHPLNFEYADHLCVTDSSVQVSGQSFSADIHCHEITPFCTRLSFANPIVKDKRNHSDAILEDYRDGRLVQPSEERNQVLFATMCSRITVDAAQLKIALTEELMLSTTADGFGYNGETFILNFDISTAAGCYGFGERTKHFNKLGDSLECWTVDVVAVFPHTYERNDYDPTYVAIPLAIVKTGARYTGLYFDNPGRTLLDVGKTRTGQLMYQSALGDTQLYIIAGPSLRQVVRHFSTLTGRAAVPPLWSLGYHQCRWSYESEMEMRALKAQFDQHDIPVSALWYDIDYMDGYRLFTWNKTRFPTPAALNNELKQAGIHTVAIVDPGVKREPSYAVYDSGVQQEVFCKTASGRDYVGRVWPGDTVFPDFTQALTRDWWAEQLADFLQDSALDGAWLDMNDPATGFSDPEDMRFAGGSVAHAHYHNQYAHYMAMASHQAFTRNAPDARPFLLTRSAYTGTQRYSAVWTGDNVSEWQHLRMAIPCTLNLGLSGFAHSGPDVGGFLGHSSAELLIRWYQTCFLFPFFRNHSARYSKPQEPWQFGEPCLNIARQTIMTRYRLLPYLYACAFHHHLTGDPIVRPLLYEYEDAEFEHLDDQYLVGDALLVAPILNAAGTGQDLMQQGIKKQCRTITFPPGRWFDLNRGEWLSGGRILHYAVALDEIPLFARDGAIIPYYNGAIRNSDMDLSQLELHIFSDGRNPAQGFYYVDDRTTQAYTRGHFNIAGLSARLDGDTWTVKIDENGHYPLSTVVFKPIVYGCSEIANKVTVVCNNESQSYTLQPATRPWLGQYLPVLA